MESLAHGASKQFDLSQEITMNFYVGTLIFYRDMFYLSGMKHKNLKNLIRENNIVISRGDKDSSQSTLKHFAKTNLQLMAHNPSQQILKTHHLYKKIKMSLMM